MWRPASRDQEIDQHRKGVNIYMLMTYLRGLLAQLTSDEEGQTAIEYALVLALIAVVIVGVVAGALTLLVPQIMTNITNALTAA
jgi:Flp pilus assembly pilin Flp